MNPGPTMQWIPSWTARRHTRDSSAESWALTISPAKRRSSNKFPLSGNLQDAPEGRAVREGEADVRTWRSIGREALDRLVVEFAFFEDPMHHMIEVWLSMDLVSEVEVI
jgi:hypothetical protein